MQSVWEVIRAALDLDAIHHLDVYSALKQTKTKGKRLSHNAFNKFANFSTQFTSSF